MSPSVEKKKEIIQICMQHDILVPATLLNSLPDTEIEQIHSRLVDQSISPEQTLSLLQKKPEDGSSVRVLSSYAENSAKRSVQDFTSYFTTRYLSLSSLLKERGEFQSPVSIRRIPNKPDGDTVTLIGMVYAKDITKNNNIILTLEDPTGQTKVFVGKNKPDLFRFAQDIVLDEVIGVVGKKSQSLIFADIVRSPDIPVRPLKTSPDEAYAVVLSDIEFGSANFMEQEFQSFIEWIRGEKGSEKHRQMAALTKYIFIVGDLVAGVGIYPRQEQNLAVPDIYKQYEIAVEMLRQIPTDKHIILCPGNHDAIRIAEPQPALAHNPHTEILHSLPNVILVSNPSWLRIHESSSFSGFDVLLYHGFSYPYYSDNVPSIRESGLSISDRTDLVMKHLLQKRHLSPTYTSNLFIPTPDQDPLFIHTIPDFFFSGHIHKFRTSTYRNTLMICGSCWEPQSPFQEKMGHTPEPCKVPVIHLHDRKVTVLNFQQ